MGESATIFVSVKNKKDIIEKCINSLLQFDWPNKEILVIDNMSSDGSYDKLLQYKDKIILRRMAGGVSEVFNWALARSEKEYFICTDADCVVDAGWVKELIAPFATKKGVVATAGFCGTPEKVNFLQKLIGLELENRYRHFKKYIERAPTMNLCFKTEAAKKVMFDESFIYQSFEVDFCYRLTEYGKILYVPSAKVWHYHRSSILSYIKQQKDQAKWGWKLLMKHGRKAIADQITTFNMSIQILLLGLSVMTLLVFPWVNHFLYVSLFFLLLLLVVYVKNIMGINPPLRYFPAFLALFFIRTVSWGIGSIEGFLAFSIRSK